MKKTLILNLACVAILSGCNTENFLDLKPESALVEENYFKTTGEVETGVLNIYDALQKVAPFEIQLTELRSDNISPANLEGEWAAIENFNETSSNDFINSFWITSYATVARCNIVLKYLPNVTDATKKLEFEGEAKFIRALQFFNLVRLFGDVPMPLTSVQVDDQQSLARVASATVYEQIVADLLVAESNLPEKWDAAYLGRATKGAAQTLLAKVYLTQKNYAGAKGLLESVIASKNYQLRPNYADVFSPGAEMNNEIIFAIRYRSAANGEGQGFSYDFSKDGATRGLKPMSDLLGLYGTVDTKRMSASILGTGTDAFVNKFPDAANTGARRDAGTDWIVLRYADVLLMYSEVLTQLDELSQVAVAPLNQVRERAGITLLTAADLATKASLMTAIENERRIELAFENYRWFDLLRWGTAKTAMTKHFAAIGRNITVEDFRLLYPIPQRDIDLSKVAIKQNPGY